MRSSLWVVVLVGCGGSVVSETPSDGGVDGPARRAAVHRASPVACPTTRPPGSAGAVTGGSCTSDADCTAGKNGRCIGSLPAVPSCSYDQCFSDAECGGAVCVCRSDVYPQGPNVCVRGGCVTDADCGAYDCSPSGLGLHPNCTVSNAKAGWFCHGAADECIDDADCSDGSAAHCAFDETSLHFRCLTAECAL